MNKSILFLCGAKGYLAIRDLSNSLISKIDFIVVAKELGVVEDFSQLIIKWALKHNIKVIDRNDYINQYNPHLCVAIGWKWLIPPKETPNLITIHDSLLPKYRGFNPLVTALIEGDEEIGATAIFASKDIDKGPILFQKKIQISYPIKIWEAMLTIGDLCHLLLSEILIKSENLGEGSIQDESESSYSLWRDENDYWIDWSADASKILRQIHASGYPYLGARTSYNGNTIKILDGEIHEDENIINRTCGKILSLNNGSPLIVCGRGILKLTQSFDFHDNKIHFSKLKVRLGGFHFPAELK